MTEREEKIQKRVLEHLLEAHEHFPMGRMVGIFLQGSQNYGLDYELSDVDTKLIVTPSFKDIVFNKSPISTTHVRENEEHIDFKDIRLYIQTFRKQNLNFLEILFTPFKFLNPDYEFYWNCLVEEREAISHYNLYQAIKAMKGVAMEKYHAMEHPYPSKAAVLEKYGYDPKQLHHLLRVEDYIRRYIAGETYENCLKPENPEYLMRVKRGCYNLEDARRVGKESIDRITKMADEFALKAPNVGDPVVDDLLNEIQYDIMKVAVEKELK